MIQILQRRTYVCPVRLQILYLTTLRQNPNRVGNIPMHWYDDLPHIGYNVEGKKVFRPARGDELDKFLKTVEDPTAWYVTA